MPQVLHLINGEGLDRRIGSGEGRLKALLDSGKADREVADELFLSAFARYPTAEQWRAVESALAGTDAGREAVFRDLLWALVNAKEFLFSH